MLKSLPNYPGYLQAPGPTGPAGPSGGGGSTGPTGPAGSGSTGGVQSVVQGAGVTVTNTDPLNPIINSTVVISVSVSAAELASGGKDLFTPAGSDLYICNWMGWIANQSTNFAGGNKAIYIQFDQSDGVVYTVYSAGDLPNVSTTPTNYFNNDYVTILNSPGNTIRANYMGGTTNWTSGVLHVLLFLIKVN